MDTVEKGLALFFGAIIIGLILSNPRGISSLLNGISTFSHDTVGAFSGGKGFVNG